MKKMELELSHDFVKGLITAHEKEIDDPQQILDKLNREWIIKFNMSDKGKDLDIKEIILRNSVFSELILVTLMGKDHIEFKDMHEVSKYVSMGIGIYNGEIGDDKI